MHAFGLASGPTCAEAQVAAIVIARGSRQRPAFRERKLDTGAKLRSVNAAIGQVSVAASGIATAVGEQRFTALEVDAGTARAVDVADEIGTRIDGVAKAAGSAASLSASVRGSASELAKSARNLRSSTDLFVSFLQSDEAAA